MSLEVRAAVLEALDAIPNVNQRVHQKIFSVVRPAYEVLYAGRMRDGNRYVSRFEVVIWGGPDHAPNAQQILQLAVERVTDALWPVDCVLIGDVNVDVQIPGLSDLPFTRASLMVTEA